MKYIALSQAFYSFAERAFSLKKREKMRKKL
jgi:hypothetical protein